MLSTGAPASNGPKGSGSGQKSASYLNMTSSFRNKVEGPFGGVSASEARSGKANKGNSLYEKSKGNGGLRSQANLHTPGKLSGFGDQNQRAVGQGGRQPTQKKKATLQVPGVEGEYASFGGKDVRGRRGKNGSVSFDKVDPEESVEAGHEASKPGVFDRLSNRDGSSDPHCHSKHPDNWKWRPDAPGAPVRGRKRSTSNSANAATIAEQPENDYDDNFKIKMIPTGKR